MIRVLFSALLMSCLAACASYDAVQFRASNPQQQAMMRDGRPAISSRQKSSLVLVSPARRQIKSGSRPVYVVAIYNLARTPVDFRVSDVEVIQTVNGQPYQIAVLPYETLVQEEKNRQVAAAILTGVAAAGNAYSASQAGHGTFNATSYGPRGGTVTTSGSYYDPTANAIAQNNAAAQNEAMISATIAQGQANLATLERSVIKDNTLMPGEWYGGQLHLAPPKDSSNDESKSYTISVLVGSNKHVIDVTQVRSR
jgi:hypothetical protein